MSEKERSQCFFNVLPPFCASAGLPGPNAMLGTRGKDYFCGLGGNDSISGLQGNDVIKAGSWAAPAPIASTVEQGRTTATGLAESAVNC